MLPGMNVRMTRVRPDTSMPLTSPLSTCHASTPVHVPPSGSSPTQHGHSVLHVQTSNNRPSSWYDISHLLHVSGLTLEDEPELLDRSTVGAERWAVALPVDVIRADDVPFVLVGEGAHAG